MKGLLKMRPGSFGCMLVRWFYKAFEGIAYIQDFLFFEDVLIITSSPGDLGRCYSRNSPLKCPYRVEMSCQCWNLLTTTPNLGEMQNEAERMKALGKRGANWLFLSLCPNQLQETNCILNGNLYLSKNIVFCLMKPCQFGCSFEINECVAGMPCGKNIFLYFLWCRQGERRAACYDGSNSNLDLFTCCFVSVSLLKFWIKK